MASVFEEPQTKNEQRKRLSDGHVIDQTDATDAVEKFDPIALMVLIHEILTDTLTTTKKCRPVAKL